MEVCISEVAPRLVVLNMLFKTYEKTGLFGKCCVQFIYHYFNLLNVPKCWYILSYSFIKIVKLLDSLFKKKKQSSNKKQNKKWKKNSMLENRITFGYYILIITSLHARISNVSSLFPTFKLYLFKFNTFKLLKRLSFLGS